MGAYETVKIERGDGIGWVILNRPEKRNAMNPTMHYEMLDVWEEMQFDDEVKVVILAGEGKSWCAGQDLKESFMATANDPAFLEDAVKTQIDILPMTGVEVEAFIARLSASPAKD